jgi:hypothetical protein
MNALPKRTPPHRTISPRLTRAALALSTALLASGAWATQVITEDVAIQDPNPALIFDDSSSADGYEFVIRGRDEFFSIDDDINTRTYFYIRLPNRSVALGERAAAVGAFAAALGYEAEASGSSALALGRNAISSGLYSTALGFGTVASGGNDTAIGRGATTSAGTSLALGYFATASGISSAALGVTSTAGGISSLALGESAQAAGDRASAVGYRAIAPQADSVIIGAINGINAATAYANVGMGTATPAEAVDVERSAAAARFQLTSFTNTATEAPQYIQRRARGNRLVPSAVQSNDNLGLFSFRGYNGTVMGGSRATITAQAAGNFSVSSTPTRLIFATTPSGQTAPVQVMEITHDGKVKVNGTALNVPDYVFEDDYALMPLDELRSFIDANGHLPGIASADTVKSQGLDLAGSQMGHLQKIEELTLYTLQQQARIDRLETMVSQLMQERE